ncbi:MAG TPA: TIM barrel protein [Candidatus Sulfopaludibacter sp.]|nr:TIM barrel protein [Candidatus Sulfopaludibacter sp.]
MSKIIISPKKGKQGIGAGVWNLGAGRDPFGGPTRRDIPVLDRIPLLAEAGITYVEAHDVEISLAEIPLARKRLQQHGLKMGMYTPSFFANPVFKDGAMTSNDGAVRKLALRNAWQAVDATVALGAEVMVFWNGREGFDFVLAKNGQDAFRRLVDGFNVVGEYALKKYGKRCPVFAIEPKPNEPRANMYLSNVGEVLYLISRLDPAVQPLFGVNPETAHSRMAGLDYVWDVELCLEAGKLFHIHLNSQDTSRYDQDMPFGYMEPLKDLALCVVLQDAKWEGILAFDVKAPRTDREEDIADILRTSAANLQRLWARALKVDRKKIAGFRAAQQYTALAGYLAKCLY